MNPTVSDRSALRREGRFTERIVGSSVANMRGEASTSELRERIEQRGFPRVGVTDERDRGDWDRFAPLPLLGADAPHVFELLLDVTDAAVNLAPVGFQLRFTRTTGANAAAQLRHLDAASGEPWEHVVELGQFHLQLSFPGAGVAGKNVENELGPVNDPRVHDAFDIALLRRREIVVEQDYVGGDRRGRSGNFFQLAFADESRRFGAIAMLHELTRDLRARAGGQRSQLVKRLFGTEIRRIRGQGRNFARPLPDLERPGLPE